MPQKVIRLKSLMKMIQKLKLTRIFLAQKRRYNKKTFRAKQKNYQRHETKAKAQIIKY